MNGVKKMQTMKGEITLLALAIIAALSMGIMAAQQSIEPKQQETEQQ